MPEFTETIKFDVYCADCGYGLCTDSEASNGSGYVAGKYYKHGRHLAVKPCSQCIKKAKETVTIKERK
mgnify:CR=1 FL=1